MIRGRHTRARCSCSCCWLRRRPQKTPPSSGRQLSHRSSGAWTTSKCIHSLMRITCITALVQGSCEWTSSLQLGLTQRCTVSIGFNSRSAITAVYRAILPWYHVSWPLFCSIETWTKADIQLSVAAAASQHTCRRRRRALEVANRACNLVVWPLAALPSHPVTASTSLITQGLPMMPRRRSAPTEHARIVRKQMMHTGAPWLST